MLKINQIDNNTVVDIPLRCKGLRLDTTLAIIIPDISRNRLQSWIKNQRLTVDGNFVAVNYRVKGTEKLHFIHAIAEPQDLQSINTNDIQTDDLKQFVATNIPINVVYEDADIIVVNKPAGLVVHPGANNYDNTLMNALLFHYKELYDIPRAGIVHRIDKDTSGLLVIARNLSSHWKLVQQLSKHTMHRVYKTIVYGHPTSNGKVDANIVRDQKNRTRMMITKLAGKEAVTNYKIVEYFSYEKIKTSLLECRLETGRTHQIRVHMQHLGFPILGDHIYGQNKINILQNVFKVNPNNTEHPLMIARQALHAEKLRLIHPSTGEEVEFVSDLPEDFVALLNYLRELM